VRRTNRARESFVLRRNWAPGCVGRLRIWARRGLQRSIVAPDAAWQKILLRIARGHFSRRRMRI